MDDLSQLLTQLAELIAQERFIELESDTIELKPCPSNSQDWTERYKSINAFLNSRGGILVLGIKEIGQGPDRKYHFSGYNSDAEAKLTELKNIFSDIEGRCCTNTGHG